MQPPAAVERRLTTRRSSGRPSYGTVLFFSTRVLWLSNDGDSRGAGLFPLIRFLPLRDFGGRSNQSPGALGTAPITPVRQRRLAWFRGRSRRPAGFSPDAVRGGVFFDVE